MFLDGITSSQTETSHIHQHSECLKRVCTTTHRLTSVHELTIRDKKCKCLRYCGYSLAAESRFFAMTLGFI